MSDFEQELNQWRKIAGINTQQQQSAKPAQLARVDLSAFKLGSKEYMDAAFPKQIGSVHMPAGFRGRKK